MDMVWELIVCVLQFKSNCIITNKIYHKKGQKYISQQYNNFQIYLQTSHTHTHTHTHITITGCKLWY